MVHLKNVLSCDDFFYLKVSTVDDGSENLYNID